jgi:hypothetical protein
MTTVVRRRIHLALVYTARWIFVLLVRALIIPTGHTSFTMLMRGILMILMTRL